MTFYGLQVPKASRCRDARRGEPLAARSYYREVIVAMVATSPVQAASGQSRFTTGPAIVWYIAGAVLLLELLTANRYGYFGDEREICSKATARAYSQILRDG